MPIPALSHFIGHREQHWQPLSMKTRCPFLPCHTVSAIACSTGSHWLHWTGASLSTVQKTYWSHLHTPHAERHPKVHIVFCHFTGLSFPPRLWSKISYNYCDCVLLAHSTYSHKCNKKNFLKSDPHVHGEEKCGTAIGNQRLGQFEKAFVGCMNQSTWWPTYMYIHADADTFHFRPNTICGIGGGLLVRNSKWTISINAYEGRGGGSVKVASEGRGVTMELYFLLPACG